MKIRLIWILWCSDKQKPWIEDVFAHKVMAEKVLRLMKESDDGRGYHYWLQEKEVNNEQSY